MTKEQAIEVLRCNTNLGYGIVIENESTQLIKEAIEMAIKALEQQPSDDCVSREEVQKFVSYIQSIKDSHNEEDTPINYGTICDLVIRGWKLVELPSVTPARKSGLCWIERFDNESMWLECPHCHIDSIAAYNYCPNCGASFKEEKRGNENEIN